MAGKERLTNHFRLVQRQSSMRPLEQPDFAWEIMRRHAGYQAGALPARRVILSPTGKAVTLIECRPPVDRSWGLLFRGGPTPLGA